MRVSTDKDDPGFANYEAGKTYRVTLDGVDVTKLCDMADEEQGVVRTYKVHPVDGGIFSEDGINVAVDHRKGKVVITCS